MRFLRKYTRIDRLFAITGLLILLLGAGYTSSSFDLVIHDTYFVISYFHIGIVVSSLFMLLSLVYFLLIRAGKLPVKILSGIHYFFTLLPGLGLLIFRIGRVDRYVAGSNMSEEMENWGRVNTIFSVCVLLCLLGQVIFLVNIFIALLRKRANP
jgi:heme/copper-type cytochrome/quinol oxidase subunit 1